MTTTSEKIKGRKKSYSLRLCPFCGKTPSIVHTTPYWVRCESCGADGPSRRTASYAANAWNGMSYRCTLKPVFLDTNGDFCPPWKGTL